jgi:tubulin polyglutamylase TTLL6/13
MAFQILGFDIMIDKNFRPWLIEVNQSPSFATDSPLDYEVKKAVLKDTFRLLNVN